MDAEEEQRINDRLVAFARETSNQVLVLIVDTLCGEEPADFAFGIGERWGIGQKGFDNGIVILIKPTGSAGSRKVFIATGYGLEGAIPDATCRRIVDNEVIPRFKQGEFAQGIDAALNVIFPLAKGDRPRQLWPQACAMGRRARGDRDLGDHGGLLAQRREALCPHQQGRFLDGDVAVEPDESRSWRASLGRVHRRWLQGRWRFRRLRWGKLRRRWGRRQLVIHRRRAAPSCTLAAG
ncbi:MAG: TPM domain-containing protein [Flavobacteriales bacterium]|nr:TPM domain-containing protein [Flavobacteriales bacterium]